MSVYFYEPFYNVDRVFDGPVSSTGKSTTSTITFRPKMDLHEDAEKNTVTATIELPGLKKEDLEIDVHDNRLTISGRRQVSSEHKEDGYAIRERSYGKFSRLLKLPRGVKEEDIKASLKNGILTVTFPKTTPETEPRKITIS